MSSTQLLIKAGLALNLDCSVRYIRFENFYQGWIFSVFHDSSAWAQSPWRIFFSIYLIRILFVVAFVCLLYLSLSISRRIWVSSLQSAWVLCCFVFNLLLIGTPFHSRFLACPVTWFDPIPGAGLYICFHWVSLGFSSFAKCRSYPSVPSSFLLFILLMHFSPICCGPMDLYMENLLWQSLRHAPSNCLLVPFTALLYPVLCY